MTEKRRTWCHSAELERAAIASILIFTKAVSGSAHARPPYPALTKCDDQARAKPRR